MGGGGKDLEVYGSKKGGGGVSELSGRYQRQHLRQEGTEYIGAWLGLSSMWR